MLDLLSIFVGSSAQSCIASSSFFFSSRRRHTRSDRDWSSDVCSSDLPYGVTEIDAKGGMMADPNIATVKKGGTVELQRISEVLGE